MKNQIYLFLLVFFLAGNLIAKETAPEDNKKIYKQHSNRGFYNSEPTEHEKFLMKEAEKNKKRRRYALPKKEESDILVIDEI